MVKYTVYVIHLLLEFGVKLNSQRKGSLLPMYYVHYVSDLALNSNNSSINRQFLPFRIKSIFSYFLLVSLKSL